MKRVSARWLLALAFTAMSFRAAPAAAPPLLKSWHFDVLLDGKRIGEHVFELSARGPESELRTRASFRVTLLRVPLYRYEHENRELWRDGCLTRMDAYTRDNGQELVTRGASAGSVFEVRGPQNTARLPGCVKSFAYWDRSILAEKQLLNAQTGEYEAVEFENFDPRTIEVSGRRVLATRHTLRARQLHIDLWYSSDGEWLALESLTDTGRRLRYEAR